MVQIIDLLYRLCYDFLKGEKFMKKYYIIIIVVILLLIGGIFIYDNIRTIETKDEDIYQKAVEFLGENTAKSKSPYAYKLEESSEKIVITSYTNNTDCPKIVNTYILDNNIVTKIETINHYRNKHVAKLDYNDLKKNVETV